MWFHLECPRAAAKFDNPLEFKRKFRDFFAEQRTAVENVKNISADGQKIKDEYDLMRYPEDVKEKKDLR